MSGSLLEPKIRQVSLDTVSRIQKHISHTTYEQLPVLDFKLNFKMFLFNSQTSSLIPDPSFALHIKLNPKFKLKPSEIVLLEKKNTGLTRVNLPPNAKNQFSREK